MRRWNLGVPLSLAVIGGCLIFGHSAFGPAPLLAQYSTTPTPDNSVVYQCPMDPEVRSNKPGKCPICGMEMRAGIPEPIEFPMSFSIAPQPLRAGAKEQFTFAITDPENGKKVEHLQEVHEKAFHMFIVSQDMNYFIHDHPVFDGTRTAGPPPVWFVKDGKLTYDENFPRPGFYRILGDFCPDGASCQLNAKSVIVPGGKQTAPKLTRDYGPKPTSTQEDGALKPLPASEAMTATITTEPPEPLSGTETRIFLHLDNSTGLEQYIGAWSHVLAASDDLIDLIHTHPFTADGGPDMAFHIYFGRQHVYRVWMQFQKKGKIQTVYFDIPVKDLD